MTVRPSIAAFSIGTRSHSAPSVITMPPTCCERCRGKPISSPLSSITRRTRASSGFSPISRTRASAMPSLPQRSQFFAIASTQSSGRPIALPTSRTALRPRYEITSAVIAARSRP